MKTIIELLISFFQVLTIIEKTHVKLKVVIRRYHMKMKTGGKIIVSVLSVLAVGTLALGAVYALNPNFKKTADDWITSVIVHDSTSGSESVSESGSESVQPELAVRQQASGTDEQGHAYITFSYTLTPSNTSYTDIVATLSWKQHTVSDVIADFLSASVNREAKTITVTCLAPFSNVAELTIKSERQTSLQAKVEIHCGQKFLGFYESVMRGDYFYNTQSYEIENSQGQLDFNNAMWGIDVFSSVSKGFTETFTDPINTTPTINWSRNIEKQIQFIVGYGNDLTMPGSFDELNATDYPFKLTMVNSKLQSATKTLVTTLFDEDSFGGAGSVAHPYAELVDSVQADINYWSLEAREALDYNMIGISYPISYSATIAGQSKTIDANIVLMFDISDFTLTVPLSGISPEVPSITF